MRLLKIIPAAHSVARGFLQICSLQLHTPQCHVARGIHAASNRDPRVLRASRFRENSHDVRQRGHRVHPLRGPFPIMVALWRLP